MSWFYAKATASVDADAQDYFDRIVAAGSTIDTTARAAVNDFVVGCKADSIWTLLLDVGTFCGSNLVAGVTKLKTFGAIQDEYSAANFVNGDFSQSTGLTGNGSDKYLDTGLTASSLTSGSSGICLYDRSTVNSTEQIHGVWSSSTVTFTLYTPYSDNKVYSDQYNEANQINSGSTISGAVGFIHGVRTSGPQHALYRNGTQIATTGTVGGSLPSTTITFFGRRNAGIVQYYSAHTISFIAITAGMDSTQAAALYTRVQALQTALGRNV
jgi:hypothetical protein